MAIHGDAEELSYYRFLAERGKGDLVESSKCTQLFSRLSIFFWRPWIHLAEHHEIKKLVYDADTSFSGSDFDEKLAKAFQAFDTHAREEEQGILPEMENSLSAQEKDVSPIQRTCTWY